MNYVMIVLSCCLWAQVPGNSGVDPIRPARPAPPAELGDPPQESAVPGALAPAGDPRPDPNPADSAPEVPDRYRKIEAQPVAPAEPPDQPEPSTQKEPAGRLETLGNAPHQKLRPPELVAEALENPQQEALVGTPLSLSQALARARDRQQQLKITGSYWRLASAQAEYHWALKQRDVVRDRTGSHANLAGALAAQASTEADVRDAQLAVEQAQQELADLLGQGVDRAAPLASDRPHVGEYRTSYDSIFGSRVPPARIRLIHRTLPVRRKAIDAHAEAIVAAIDAVESAGQHFHDSAQGLSTLLDAIKLLGHERRTFIAEVRAYNLDIADYAFAVAPAGAAGDTLVSMLIRTSPPADTAPTNHGPTPARNPNPPIQKTFRQQPNGAAAANDHPDDWTTNNSSAPVTSIVDDPGVYQGLLDVSNHPLRVQKLGNLLHWDRNLPPESGHSVELAECLRRISAERRLVVIRAFWSARQSAARYQVLTERQEQLNALQSIAIPLRDQPGMAEAGVRLQAARRSARAAVLDAESELLASQFELTAATGQPLDEAWLLPSTAPQSGRYQVSMRVKHDSLRGAQLADRLALEYDRLRHRADAVIQCDALRAELVLQARRNETVRESTAGQITPLDRVIWATGRQTEQALAFLDDLTDYNMAIANYALMVLPASVSAEDLAEKLAIKRTTLRDS
ncbi:MAG: hypothetical protein WD468_05060 [Pirellulales bacterium]